MGLSPLPILRSQRILCRRRGSCASGRLRQGPLLLVVQEMDRCRRGCGCAGNQRSVRPVNGAAGNSCAGGARRAVRGGGERGTHSCAAGKRGRQCPEQSWGRVSTHSGTCSFAGQDYAAGRPGSYSLTHRAGVRSLISNTHAHTTSSAPLKACPNLTRPASPPREAICYRESLVRNLGLTERCYHGRVRLKVCVACSPSLPSTVGSCCLRQELLPHGDDVCR